MTLRRTHPQLSTRSGRRGRWLAGVLASLAVAVPTLGRAQTIITPYDETYILVDLGPVPNVPPSYGGLAPYPFDPDLFFVAGAAETAQGRLYLTEATRDATGHITGFLYASTHAYVDGIGTGLDIGPSNNSFLSSQYKALAQVTTRGDQRSAPLEPFLSVPLAGVGFVPEGQGGAGQLKATTLVEGLWGTLAIAPDGMGFGTYSVVGATMNTALAESTSSFAYVPLGAPEFPNASLLASERITERISAYDLDANGDPIRSTYREVILGFPQPMGMTVDPVTGDFLISSASGRIFLLRPAPPPTPAVCSPVPLATCAAPGRATLSYQVSQKDQRKRKMKFRWMKGSSTAFGDPLEDGTNYRLCIYDDDNLRFGLAVSAGGTCNGKPCWKASGSGFTYKNRNGNENGVTQLKLQEGAGDASILLLGKGQHLASPFPISATVSFTAQLVKNSEDGPECWGARFLRPARIDALKNLFYDSVP